MPQADTTTFPAAVRSCREIHELPGDWSPPDLRRLLGILDIDVEDSADADLPDLALMALGDLEPYPATAAVLEAVFGDTMAEGVRANLAADLGNERPWEQLSDLTLQAGVFTATVLLQRALPRHFGKPDALRAEIEFTAPSADDAAQLAAAPAAVILRALAPGLGPRSLVVRLYSDGLRHGDFPEAAHILWRCTLVRDEAEPRRVVADVCGAVAFLETLTAAGSWQADVVLPGES